MFRTLTFLFGVSLVLMAGAAAQAGEWIVDFESPHDFLADGVDGTGWDGFLGLEPGQTVSALNMAMERPGELFMSSADAFWHAPWNPLGPFLYKIVEGDFKVTVRVTAYTNVTHNNGGLLVRAIPGDLNGENWVALDYFPIWSCGNFVRSATNNSRAEHGHNGLAFNLHPWMQIEREGNVFHFRTSTDGVTWITHAQSPRARDDFDGLALQVGLYQGTYSTNLGSIAYDDFKLEGPNVSPPGEAYNPSPASQTRDIVRDKVFSWMAPETAVSFDVYFGTVEEDVTAADRTNPLDVLVSQGQAGATYDHPAVFPYGQTYYWRVDVVEADGTINTGRVWTFEVEPFSYPVENIFATASDFRAGSGPEKTVDRSGLNPENDQHSDVAAHQWQVNFGDDPVWIQYEFGQVYKLDELWVWNANPQFEQFLNFSAKDVTIEYAVEPNEWTTLGEYTFEKGTGLTNYTYNTTVNFDGALAKYVRININSTYGGAQTGLSEVRFFQIPGAAREPQPASGAANVDPEDVVLSWRPGREAAFHEVHFGPDSNAVAEGDALVATTTETSYATGLLELGQTYYWRIDEVNEAETPAVWEGAIWNFSTPEFLVVDNFESYDGEDNLIYDAWVDGYGVAANGSQVGHNDRPYVERTIVRSGSQSMPFYYGQEGATTSEATLTLPVPQDWTRSGAQTLVLFFRGALGNAAGQLYVKVNDTRINYPGGAAGLAAPIWRQWNIDLATLGNAARNVRSVTIGVAGSGTGLLHVDDIRLYRDAPPMAEPAVDPGTANLMAYYPMSGNANDASGNGYDGTVETGSSFGDGPTGYGQAIILDGAGGHVTLPIGPLVQSLSSATFATWVNRSGTGGAWQRVFDFGTGTGVNMFLTPNGGGVVRFAITTSGGGGEQRLNRTGNLATGWQHVAVTIDGTTNGMNMYINGNLVASNTTDVLPMDLGNTTQNWLGRSQYAADAYFNGSIDDFRIYNRALSEPEVRYLVGDR